MKRILASGLLLALLFSPAMAQSQQEMNQQAAEEYKAADAELNKMWTQLQPLLTPEVKSKLVESQLQWIKFRDSEAAAKAAIFEGGSMAPMIYSSSLKRTTETRIEELKDWLEAVSH